MSEMRNLQEDINYLKTRDYHNEPSVQIGFHAIDRAIAAEKERDELREREFNHYPILILEMESERDKWKAEAEDNLSLINAEYETALRYMRDRDELRKRVEALEKELVAHKCPDCAVTDLEYCPEHHSARTETWSGGDGW